MEIIVPIVKNKINKGLSKKSSATPSNDLCTPDSFNLLLSCQVSVLLFKQLHILFLCMHFEQLQMRSKRKTFFKTLNGFKFVAYNQY